MEHDEYTGRLWLPSDDESQWNDVLRVLATPIEKLSNLDGILTEFASLNADREPRACTFFSTIPEDEKESKNFDWNRFFEKGVPAIIKVALEMPDLFPDPLSFHRTRSASQKTDGSLESLKTEFSRKQCASLLAHSFLGSLKRPPGDQRNDFRFTIVDLFMGSAVSPNSALMILNYFSQCGEFGFSSGIVKIERLGFRRNEISWNWEECLLPLAPIKLKRGQIESCEFAEMQTEFANAFVGGGVLSGDAAMEELLFCN